MLNVAVMTVGIALVCCVITLTRADMVAASRPKQQECARRALVKHFCPGVSATLKQHCAG